MAPLERQNPKAKTLKVKGRFKKGIKADERSERSEPRAEVGKEGEKATEAKIRAKTKAKARECIPSFPRWPCLWLRLY